MAYGSFEELEVWQRACRLSIEIINLMRNCREWALRDQMMKASLSIPSNIAEGAERGSIADFIRFLHIAKGSAAELRTQLFIVRDLGGILPEAKCQDFIEEAKRLSSMLQSLIKSLRK